MTVLTLCRNESETSELIVMSTIDDDFGDNIRPEITPPMIASLPELRPEKITSIRLQLARGTYDRDERLDAVLERILTDLEQ